MSLLEDDSIKTGSNDFWKITPYIITFLVVTLLLATAYLKPEFLTAFVFLLIGFFILITLIWKFMSYINPNNKEVREYEKEMEKRGRR